jgi:hypothetical protein
MSPFIKNIISFFSGKLQKTSNYMSIILLYIVVSLLQIIYIYYITRRQIITELDKKIEFNNKNYEEISTFLKEQVRERVNLLNSGKMTYIEWLDYNSKNPSVTFQEGHIYNFFVCERGEINKPGDSDVFKIAANQNEKYVNVTWRDIYSDASDQFVFLKQSLDPSTLLRFFEMGKPGINKISYYWVDYIEGQLTPILEDSYFMIIPATKEHNEAVISVSIDMINLTKENTLHYIDNINISYIAVLSILTLIISILLKVSSNNIYISYLFLLVTTFYLTGFLTSTEYRGTTDTETKKIKQINSGVLSVSFLVGVNTFIITYITKNKHNELFMQSAIIFAISIILLLFVAFQVTDYITVNQMVGNRLTNQMYFNYSLLLNIFVVVNYIFSLVKANW